MDTQIIGYSPTLFLVLSRAPVRMLSTEIFFCTLDILLDSHPFPTSNYMRNEYKPCNQDNNRFHQ